MNGRVLNGLGAGSVAATLLRCNLDPGVLRPWYSKSTGISYVTVFDKDKGKDVNLRTNATATMTKDEWLILDESVERAAKEKLRAIDDLRSRGLVRNIPQGMGKTVIQWQRISDITGARIGMDPISQSEADRPVTDLVNVPLPVIWKDFHFTLRDIMVSQNQGVGVDDDTAEMAGVKVAELAEQLLLGVTGSYSYGGGTVYGYTNHPDRITKTITLPTAGGWTGQTLLDELLDAIQLAQNKFRYGPFMLYHSPAWSKYLDNNFTAAYAGGSVRARLSQIKKLAGIEQLDFLTGYKLLLVQMDGDTVRIAIGMNVTTVRWESHGGFQENGKVLAMMVPLIKSDINGNTGLVEMDGA